MCCCEWFVLGGSFIYKLLRFKNYALRRARVVVRSQEEMTAAQINFGPSCPRRERPNIVPSHSVCRQLFGPVNHEQMREDLLREKRKLTEENTAKWNFDFENGIPLVGKYVWERIRPNLTKEMPISSCDGRVSETGKREHSCRFSLPSAETTTTSTTSSGLTNHTISDNTESEPLQNDKCDPDKPPKHLKKRKTSKKITDFLCAKKQRTSVKRQRIGRRKSTTKQTSIDLFIRKH